MRRPPGEYPNDPYFTYQWALQNFGQEEGKPGADIHALQAWRITRCSPAVVVAVVDSGIDARAPDLRSKLVTGKSFVRGSKATTDAFGHGTSVAAVAAAATNNGKGIAGVCPLGRLMPIKVSDYGANPSGHVVTQAVRWAVSQGGRVINVSLGLSRDSAELRQAIEDAYRHNVLVVAATGNEGRDVRRFPASDPHVLAVGGSDKHDRWWAASNYGERDLVLAPSVDVLTVVELGGSLDYSAETGTSYAAPEVAGLAGLILSIRPKLSVDQVVRAIEQSTDPVQGQRGYSPKQGYGRVNCYRSLLIAEHVK